MKQESRTDCVCKKKKPWTDALCLSTRCCGYLYIYCVVNFLAFIRLFSCLESRQKIWITNALRVYTIIIFLLFFFFSLAWCIIVACRTVSRSPFDQRSNLPLHSRHRPVSRRASGFNWYVIIIIIKIMNFCLRSRFVGGVVVLGRPLIS